MAYFSYHAVTGELLSISDFPIPSLDDTSVSEVAITKSELESQYEWVQDAREFKVKTYRVLTKKEFLKKITASEYATIKAATVSNGTLDYYWQLFMVAENITLDDIDTIQGINALEQFGLIAPGRAQEILS